MVKKKAKAKAPKKKQKESKPYEYLEHTADLLIQATGADFREALENAAQGMFDFLAGDVKISKSISFEEKSSSLENLVAFVLSKALTSGEISDIYFSKLKVEKFERKDGDYVVVARCFGGEGKAKGIVKAVTYHELSVKQTKNKTVIRVLLDV